MHRREGHPNDHFSSGTMTLALLLLLSAAAQGEGWPRFRGPNGQGISTDPAIPVKWSEQDYRWKISLPGGGHSSPVIWGDKVFVTCADEKALRGTILCVSASDGRELWRSQYELDKHAMNGLNSYASATPALDADHVYALWPGAGQTKLLALTHDGREVWTVGLPPVRARHGAGSSPIVCGDQVIVSREQDKGDLRGVWLALDRRTGREKWRYEHSENPNASYSTPCIRRDNRGHDQLVFTSHSHGIAGVDPETGAVLWKTPAALPARVVSSPVLCDDIVIATCGEGGRGIRLAAVRPPEADSSSAPVEVYALERGIVPYVPISVVHEGLLFTFHDQGTVSCLRAATGEVLWSEKPAGRYYGSPVCVDGRLYAVTVDGDVVVLKAGSKYELLAVNPLGEKSHATPAVANGRMYLRTFSHLICVSGRN